MQKYYFKEVVSFFFLFLFSLFSYAASLKSEIPSDVKWREKISFDEFLDLMKSKVSQIHDLKELWSYENQYPHMKTKAYLAGGTLRSFIKVITNDLNFMSLEEVKAKNYNFKIQNLILEGADQDIFLTRDAKKNWLPFVYQNSWDILEQNFLTHSIAAGGSGIEKIGLNPFDIYDPTNALKSYFSGRIEFNDVSELYFYKYRGNHSSGLRSNSKIALLLRHLRFLIQYRDIEVTKGDIEYFKSIVKKEARYLGPNNYWVTKALLKFEKQCLLRSISPVDILIEVGLLSILSKKNYKLESSFFYSKVAFDTFEDINDAKRMYTTSEHIIAIIEANMNRVKTVAEFEMLLDPVFSNPHDDFLFKLSELRSKYAKKFIELNPTFKQINDAKRMCTRSEHIIAIIEANMNRVKTVAEFEMLLDPVFRNPHPDLLNKLSELRSKYAKKFIELNPTFKQINDAKRMCTRSEHIIAIIEANMNRVKTVAEFEMLLDPVFRNPHPDLLNKLSELRSKYAKKFIEPNLFFEEFNREKSLVLKSIFDPSLKVNDYTTIDNQQALVKEYIKIASSSKFEFLKYFGFGNSNLVKIKLYGVNEYELVVNLTTNAIVSKNVNVSTETNELFQKASIYVRSKCEKFYTK